MYILSLRIFWGALLLCAMHDLYFRAVPDSCTYFLLAAGFPSAALRGISIGDYAFGLLFFLLCLVFWNILSKSLGGADVKITAVLIIVCGFWLALKSLAVSALLAGIFSLAYIAVKCLLRLCTPGEAKKETIPFVPFLFVGVLINTVGPIL